MRPGGPQEEHTGCGEAGGRARGPRREQSGGHTDGEREGQLEPFQSDRAAGEQDPPQIPVQLDRVLGQARQAEAECGQRQVRRGVPRGEGQTREEEAGRW